MQFRIRGLNSKDFGKAFRTARRGARVVIVARAVASFLSPPLPPLNTLLSSDVNDEVLVVVVARSERE